MKEWRDDPSITRVVLTAAGGRAFSAGGDIRALYDAGTTGRHDEMLAFYGEEYVLNTIIKHYPKPYVALIDGIVMGGGVGLSVHGSHRVAGDRFSFAMPEVSIGFFPDVGATWFLPRLPGELGAYCALTGERLNAADGVAATSPPIGWRRRALAIWPTRFAARSRSMRRSRRSRSPPGRASWRPGAAAIDRLFKGDRVENILAALDAERDDIEFAKSTAATIRAKSPTSLKLALAQMRAGATLSFQGCMQTEFRIVSRVIHGHDFYEGVRAVIVDKDNAPKWRPARLAEVSDAEVARHFAPLPNGDEWVAP